MDLTSQEIKKIIEAKYQAQLVFAKNDVLVNFENSKYFNFDTTAQEIEFGATQKIFISREEIEKSVKHANDSLKNHGVNTLCLVFSQLNWTYEKATISSPIILVPLKIVIEKYSPNFMLFPDWESSFLNPFLQNEFVAIFNNKTVPQNENEFVQFLERLTIDFDELSIKNSIEKSIFVANAHPDRFDRLRDLRFLKEEDNFSQSIEGLLGFSEVQNENGKTLSKVVLPADPSQNKALEIVQQSNLVLIGPPGTGKSQVLVNAIAQSLAKKETVLVCSEKITALNVIQKRMEQLNLDCFCHTFQAFNTNKLFIESLKKTWNFLEDLPFKAIISFQHSVVLYNQLQRTLDQLQHPTFAMGLGYEKYLSLIKNVKSVTIEAIVPNLAEWENEKIIIKNIYELGIAQGVCLISNSILSQKNHYKEAIVRIERALENTEKLDNTATLTFNGLEEISRLSSLSVHFLSHEIALDKSIFELDSKMQKRYLSLRKRAKKLQLLFELNKKELFTFISTKKQEEQLLRFKETSGLRKLLLDAKLLNTYGSKERINVALNLILEKNKISVQQTDVKIAFLELGIEDEITSDSVYFFMNIINNDQSRKRFFELSLEEKKKLSELGTSLGMFLPELKRLLRLKNDTLLISGLNQAKLALEIASLNSLEIEKLSSGTFHLLEKCSDFNQFEQLVLASNKYIFEATFPHLKDWSNSARTLKLEQIIEIQKTDATDFVQELIQMRRSNFFKFSTLLQTPTAQLSVEDKLLKQNLRKGKSILVKEFAKKRSHLPLKVLLESEASNWIKLLKPVLLSNPSHVAQQLPLSGNSFDLACIDEGSQMLLAHALPIAQRAKRIMIAGDPQQMSPSFFFQKAVDEVDVLHQAFHYFQQSSLKFHYRSEHPALLEFSNHFFYNNELVPVKRKGKSFPIQLLYCENAVYENRRNNEEAKKIANLIQYNKSKESIGLVAFSEVQLSNILDCLSKEKMNIFEDENTQNFARTIEQVQGDECDHLYVSLGYGKNSEGLLKLAFGTLNQQNGARRLNVLFSRAKKSIIFVHSIKHEDLTLSKNEGVNMLKWYLKRYESETTELVLVSKEIDQWNVGELLLTV